MSLKSLGDAGSNTLDGLQRNTGGASVKLRRQLCGGSKTF
jgi:hypothetical protein